MAPTDLADSISLAREALLPNGAPQRSPAVIERAINDLAQRAYARGRHDALVSLLTTEQVAAELGIHPRSVRSAARTRGLGWAINPRVTVFTPADVEAMRVRPVGRPRRVSD